MLFAGCTPLQVYEKHVGIPSYEWKSDFAAKGSFTIQDTTAPYNIYLVLRHTDAYKYNNIWLNIGFQAPDDSMFVEKREVSLGSDATGWLGAGMNDIWEMRKVLNEAPRKFRKKGTYFFSIQQIMRDNPLLHIMSVGIRVEKVSL